MAGTETIIVNNKLPVVSVHDRVLAEMIALLREWDLYAGSWAPKEQADRERRTHAFLKREGLLDPDIWVAD